MSLSGLLQVRSAWTLAVMLLAACSGSPTKSRPVDVSGDWVLTTRSQFGAQDATMTIVQDGPMLSGAVNSTLGTADLAGTAAADTVAFHFSIRIRGVDLRIDYAGTIEHDLMYGTAAFGPLGNGTFAARRKPS